MPPVIDGKGEKYMNKFKLNLRMFEGEGAAVGEAGEGAEAVRLHHPGPAGLHQVPQDRCQRHLRV